MILVGSRHKDLISLGWFVASENHGDGRLAKRDLHATKKQDERGMITSSESSYQTFDSLISW